MSPLARKNDQDGAFCDRFELFINGREIGNGFSELNDPDDQRSRFMAQVRAKSVGTAETMDFDEDYCRALEVGLPPTAGRPSVPLSGIEIEEAGGEEGDQRVGARDLV